MDASFIVYGGPNTPYIPITTNQTLNVILRNIDTAINTHNTAPDYTSYNLGPYGGYSITQVDGVSHPTNTQNFAEGIAKIVCNFEALYNIFVNGTYANDQLVLTTAINGLQVPGLTYSPFGIVNTDNITTVWNKSFTGFTNITNSISPAGANWSSIGASSQTTIVDAINTLIAYDLTQDAIIAGKQAAIGTFNNSTCLGGSSADNITTTINLISSYICNLPTYDSAHMSSSCISIGTSLENLLQNIINKVDSNSNNSVTAVGTGLTIGSASCSGRTIGIDSTWTGLHKTIVDASDTTPNFLANKLSAGTGISTSILNTGGDELLQITNSEPETYKIKINSSDTDADYIANKIPTVGGNWGLQLQSTVSSDNKQLYLTPNVINPSQLTTNILNAISSDPEVLSMFCALVAQCNSTCAAPTSLTVTVGPSYVMTWAAGAGSLRQYAQYRAKGSASAVWITTENISPANPLSGVATTATVSGLDSNVIYQFEVQSNCTSGLSFSNIYEQITFACQTVTTEVNTGVISVTQNPVYAINTINYRLKNNSNVVVDSQTATGLAPNVNFAQQVSGTYTIEWQYAATVNGVTVYSTDVAQLGAWCSHSITF